VIRPARPADALPMAEHFARIAEEPGTVATEPPVDLAERALTFERSHADTLVAESDGRVIGMLHLQVSRFGYAELGISVDRDRRGRGVASALMRAAIEHARGQGLHKLSLEVFPGNEPALALYRRFGFVEEGRRVRHYRRLNGELWDAIVMGLEL
jgi:ribosomal protein S18 acetylase RimI-like enzyme